MRRERCCERERAQTFAASLLLPTLGCALPVHQRPQHVPAVRDLVDEHFQVGKLPPSVGRRARAASRVRVASELGSSAEELRESVCLEGEGGRDDADDEAGGRDDEFVVVEEVELRRDTRQRPVEKEGWKLLRT